MKRLLILLTVAAVCLGGCKPAKQPEESVEPYDVLGEKTVVYHGDATFPISFTVDGVQQIPSGTYWFYELENAYGRYWEESFYTYDLKKLELSGSRPYSKLGKKHCYATNGDWPLFLNPVHTEYSASNQDQADVGLLMMAQQQLAANQMADQTPIITDLWKCDLDGDGEAETLFKACNCHGAEEGNPQYCFLGYAKGESCQVLYRSFHPDGNSPVKELRPLICDPEGDGKWSLLIEQKGDYKSITVYDFSAGNFTKNYEILF